MAAMSWIDGVMGLTEDQWDQSWVLWFCAGVAYSAGGVVHADEAKDEVAVDRTSASPRDCLVQRL